MREKPVTVSTPCSFLLVVLLLIFGLVPLSSFSLRNADAESPTAISPTPEGAGGLRTIVTPSSAPTNLCGGNCVITGGTRVETNLFHSFGQFSVGSGDITTFQNGISFDLNGNQLDAGLPTNNILGRITGVDISTIFGTIQTTGFENANLFLINPHGFLFGPNATVNVGGIATFTTADYMRLTDGGRFNANPNTTPADLLTAAPVAAFGFIGSTHAIDFKGGQLTVANGAGITLVGGDINLVPDLSGTPSGITAPGRQIRLTSVAAGPGEVAADTGVPEPGMALGAITLGQGTLLSTAGDSSFGDESGSGGSVSIRGGQLVATGATIVTSPAEGSFGSGGAVTVDVTGSATFTESLIQTSPVFFSFAGSAGAVSISANDSLTMTSTTIDTSTFSAAGNSGAVTLATNGPLSLTDSLILTFSFDSGNGGAVTITGKDVTFNRTAIFTNVDASGFDVTSDPALRQVHPGAVTVTAENTVTFTGSFGEDPETPVINASAFKTLVDAGRVTITGKTVNLSNGMVDTRMSNSGIVSPGNGGAIEIQGNNVNLTQFQLFSQAAGTLQSTGTGGSILLRGVDSIQANNIQLTASRVDTSAVTGGGGGPIELQTKGLTLSDGTIVTTSSLGPGSGGTITIRGAQNVTIESGSQVLTDVVLGGLLIPQGTAGDILFETQNLAVLSGGQIGARTLIDSTGRGGNITVQGTNSPAQSVLVNGAGSGIFTTTEGTGIGGNINILASQSVTMTNGSSVSASSTGAGNAGKIAINAGQRLEMRDSSIKTEAAQASGGKIDIRAVDLVWLVNSTISTSVLDGAGGGGDIFIDPNLVILQNNSQLLAQAIRGAGGNITIVTPLFLADSSSLVSASSQFGLNGTVTIQSPTSNLSGSLGTLTSKPNQVQSLLTQRCAALVNGQASSFVVAGREQLPVDPGGWLSSPLAFAALGGTLDAGDAVASAPAPIATHDTDMVSLRRLTPARFLIANFADSEATGCHS